MNYLDLIHIIQLHLKKIVLVLFLSLNK